MPSASPEASIAAHVAQIIKSTRALLAVGGVIEDGLDAVLRGAVEEFGCRVILRNPASMLIDGAAYQWPISEPAKSVKPAPVVIRT
jgi:hypothetical protein